MGGNKKGSFTEAWVEFEKKKVAKRVAAFLNNTRIGGKKSDFFASDLWNIKYLHKFKWTDLTQAIGTGPAEPAVLPCVGLLPRVCWGSGWAFRSWPHANEGCSRSPPSLVRLS